MIALIMPIIVVPIANVLIATFLVLVLVAVVLKKYEGRSSKNIINYSIHICGNNNNENTCKLQSHVKLIVF